MGRSPKQTLLQISHTDGQEAHENILNITNYQRKANQTTMRQRINLKNIQATPAAQYQKNKRPNQNMGQRNKQTFLQRRHTDG